MAAGKTFKFSWWWIVIIALIIIGVGFILANWDKIKAMGKKTPPAPGTPDPNNTKPVNLTTDQKTGRPLNWNLILSKGSEGGEVEALQYMLNSKFGVNLVQDGIFGDKTEKALYNATGMNSMTLTNFYNKYFSDNSEGSELSFFNQNFQVTQAPQPNQFGFLPSQQQWEMFQ